MLRPEEGEGLREAPGKVEFHPNTKSERAAAAESSRSFAAAAFFYAARFQRFSLVRFPLRRSRLSPGRTRRFRRVDSACTVPASPFLFPALPVLRRRTRLHAPPALSPPFAWNPAVLNEKLRFRKGCERVPPEDSRFFNILAESALIFPLPRCMMIMVRWVPRAFCIKERYALFGIFLQ